MQHNVQRAHGKAVRALRETVSQARIGITLATVPTIPLAAKDEECAYQAYFEATKENFVWSESAWFDPIALARYPEQLIKACADCITAKTVFKNEDLAVISEKIDFVGLNIYYGRYVGEQKHTQGDAHTDMNWPVTETALQWGTQFFSRRYALPMYITENGMAQLDWVSLDGKVHDTNRIDFLHRYLLGLKTATENGADIRGYFQWSFLDNFEWAEGYGKRFGIIYCDYQTQKRIPKDSAWWYKHVIETNGAEL